MSDKKQHAEKPKADPSKPFDVIVSVINDNRKGIAKPVRKPARYSFATEAEATSFADKIDAMGGTE